MKRHMPKAEGYVEPETKRVAVLAGRYADSDLNGSEWAYYFVEENVELGLDPWVAVEGVDRYTVGDSMDICFANGATKKVGPLMTIFLLEKHAMRLGVSPNREL